MKLTKEQTALLLSKLNNYNYNNGRRPCAICGNDKWLLNDTIFEMREFNGGNFIIGGKCAIMPVVSISCKECGNTLFLSAIRMGVVTPNTESSDSQKQDNPANE